MKLKKVSVIIPTYNRKDKIISTVESINKSNYPKNKIEIVIINDCSTDNTQDILFDLKKKHINLKLLKTKKNSGPATARNLGIRGSSGEYIFFTDDDCIVPKSWIKEYLDFFQKYPKVYGAGGILEPKIKNYIFYIEKFKDKILGISYNKKKIGKKEIKTGFTCNCVYRKEVFDTVGFFKENFRVPAGEDLEFSQRVAKKYQLGFIPIKVIHNHNYNLDYLLAILYKQGLGEMPPKNKKLFGLIKNSPRLLNNIVKKTINYRK